MIFLFLVPSVPATIGNFLIPITVRAKDLAFPKINLLSWYLYVAAGLFILWSLITGGVDTGWTFHYSAEHPLPQYQRHDHRHRGVHCGFQLHLHRPQFIVTIHRMRCPGMTWFRRPCCAGPLPTILSILMVLGTPVLAITLVLVALERTVGIGVFDPTKGGDPLLFQHLFWFYSHPAGCIMILPGMAVISEVISTFLRKRGFWLYRSGRFLRSSLPFSDSSSGPTICSSWAFRTIRPCLLAAYHAGGRAFRHQDLQLGGYPV